MKQKSSLILSLSNLLSHALPRRLFMTTFALLFSCIAMASFVEVDGIRYNVVEAQKTAIVISRDTKYSGAINIPSSITVNGNKYPVTSIGEKAFYECSELTSITIPNSVTSIGSYAFANCIGLTSVTIPNSVTSIGSFAFRQCIGLTSVTIPNSVTSIEECTFLDCFSLTSVTIPNSVTSIGKEAFRYCTALTSVTIGNSVINIDYCAFERCEKLETVNITDIAAWCKISFYHEESNPFYYGAKLSLNGKEVTDLVIPNSVTSIGDYAFYNCEHLTSLTLGSSVESIGKYAFYTCHLSSVKFPNSLKTIKDRAFYNNDFTSLTIPNSVTDIGNGAFYGCRQLSDITIGDGIKDIEYWAFAYCEYIENVTCLAKTVPSTNYNAFDGTYIQYATLTVPEESVEQYRAREPWKDFGLIMTTNGDVPVIPTTPKCAKPTISYANSKLVFASETEGVSFISNIKDNDIKSYYSSEIPLSATYEISVYATKTDYDNSDVTTATLIWLDARLEGGTTNAKEISVPSVPLLITQDNGMVTASGLQDGQLISAYDTTGKQIATAKAIGDAALLDLSEMQGKVAILNVAGRSAKVMIK